MVQGRYGLYRADQNRTLSLLHPKKLGMTIALWAKQLAVVGADIRLETLDETLAKQKVTPGTHVVLVNRAAVM